MNEVVTHRMSGAKAEIIRITEMGVVFRTLPVGTPKEVPVETFEKHFHWVQATPKRVLEAESPEISRPPKKGFPQSKNKKRSRREIIDPVEEPDFDRVYGNLSESDRELIQMMVRDIEDKKQVDRRNRINKDAIEHETLRSEITFPEGMTWRNTKLNEKRRHARSGRNSDKRQRMIDLRNPALKFLAGEFPPPPKPDRAPRNPPKRRAATTQRAGEDVVE